jgi:hypothetical protein
LLVRGDFQRIRHGEIRGTSFLYIFKEYGPLGGDILWEPLYEPVANMRVDSGDSGGPVWRCGSGKVVGLISAESERGDYTGIAPLVTPEPLEKEDTWKFIPFTPSQAPGVLNAPGMGDMHLALAN